MSRKHPICHGFKRFKNQTVKKESTVLCLKHKKTNIASFVKQDENPTSF